MNIHKIKIHNFKCIDDLIIDFDNITGFWEIEGAVGSGKTTIGEAILFGLFGSVRDKNNGDLIKWGEKRAVIELWCDSKNHNLYINRILNLKGQSPMTATVDGAPIIFTNKRDAQSQLEKEYYDVSRLMLETLCVISFNGFKSLSSMNTKNTNDFLDDAFGFKVISNYVDCVSSLVKEEYNTMSNIDTDIVSINRQITGYKNWKESDEHITQQMVDDVNSELKSLKDKRIRIENEFTEKRKSIYDNYTKLKSDLSAVKAQGANVKKNIDFILKGVCPTCGAPLDQSHLEEHQNERETLLKKYKDIQDEINIVSKQISELDSERNSAIDPITAEITKFEVKLNHYKSQIIQQNKFDIEINKLQQQLTKLTDDKYKTETSLNEWDELKQLLLKDVKDNVLRAMIPSINKYIEMYITELSQPYIVQFDECFTCHIQVAGVDNNISIKSLSVGQLKTVDMIIILSILKTLLTNVSFNIVFLDELLSNMDSELRDTMCKLLRKNLTRDQKVFIISHAPLNENILDGRIHVEYKNSCSSYKIEKI